MQAQTGTSGPVKHKHLFIQAHTVQGHAEIWRWVEREAGQTKTGGGCTDNKVQGQIDNHV